MAVTIDAPFIWFGGKSRAAPLIWERLGVVENYVEPFAGSLAVLLGSPHIHRTETVNDLDGFVANFWRATALDPEQTAAYCDWPVNEIDLHARHTWLLSQRATLTERLMGDPDFFDAKIAGWWCWGLNCWIGSGWCSGRGPWQSVDGRLVRVEGSDGSGVKRQRPHLGSAGQGVNRKLPHLGDAGRGVNRQLPHLGNAGRGGLYDWFADLGARLRRVRVCCGDWRRVLGPSVTTKLGRTGVVLDPPYSAEAGRDADLYSCDDLGVAHDVRAWALEHGDDPEMRIALCGYDGEHDMPGWSRAEWVAQGAYIGKAAGGRSDTNRAREAIWFSPHCESARQSSLFGEVTP